MMLERRLDREWDWLTYLGSHEPSEEQSRVYMVWGVCEYV